MNRPCRRDAFGDRIAEDSLERGDVRDFEKHKLLKELLKSDQNILLDFIQVEFKLSGADCGFGSSC